MDDCQVLSTIHMFYEHLLTKQYISFSLVAICWEPKSKSHWFEFEIRIDFNVNFVYLCTLDNFDSHTIKSESY